MTGAITDIMESSDAIGVVRRRPRRERGPHQATVLTLNLAPMVDVVFLLLIFFIVTTTFNRPEGLLASRLPKESGLASEVAPPIMPIVVHLVQTGNGPTDYAIRVENFVDTPTTFNELAAFLKTIQTKPGFDDQTPVVIDAAAEVLWDHIVGCWNAAVRAGCKRISFGVR